MPSIVPVAKLTRRDLRQLGENVMHAVELESQLAAVNRSAAAHGEAVEELIPPPAGSAFGASALRMSAPSPRPAA